MRRLGRIVGVLAVWCSMAGAVVGFFLPWATLDVKYRELAAPLDRVTQGTPLEGVADTLTKGLGRVVVKVKRGAETVTGQLPDLNTLPRQVSGFDVPLLANRQDSQIVLALAEMLTSERQLGAKSYAVYVIPGLAVLLGLVVTAACRVRVTCLAAGVVGLAVAGVACWKLLTANTQTLLVAITIGQGLWLSVWAYAGLGVSAVALALLAGPRGAARAP